MTKNFRREIGLAKELPVKPAEGRLNSPPQKTKSAAANARRMPASNKEHKKRLSSMQFEH